MKYCLVFPIFICCLVVAVLGEDHQGFREKRSPYAPDLPDGLKVRGWSEEGGWIVEDFRTGRRQNRPQLRSLNNNYENQYPMSENSEWYLSHRSANEVTYRRRVPSRPRPELRSGGGRVHMDGFNQRHPGRRINYVDQNGQTFYSYRY